MNTVARTVSIVIAIVSVLWILRSLRNQRLTFAFALSWLVVVAGMLVLAIGGDYVLNPVAAAVGVAYPPTLLFLVAVVWLLMICAHLSRQIAGLDRRLREVVQQYGLDHVREARKGTTDPAGEAGAGPGPGDLDDSRSPAG